MHKKEWAIFIYAAGRNELEPEIWRRIEELKKYIMLNNIDDKIKIFLEIGRADKKLVNIIRSEERFTRSDSDWTGIRRYVLEKNKLKLMDILTEVNMANANSLYKFLDIGFSKFLAEKNILINTVSPGPIKIDNSNFSPEYRKFRERYYQKEKETTPLKKLATLKEVFELCDFLLSEKNTHITGEEFFITGGK